MPIYRYRCGAHGRVVEVAHKMSESLTTWGEVLDRAGLDPDEAPASSPVERLLFAPNVSKASGLPSDSELAKKGFTKLVRREKGVYENVTAGEGQARIVRADD